MAVTIRPGKVGRSLPRPPDPIEKAAVGGDPEHKKRKELQLMKKAEDLGRRVAHDGPGEIGVHDRSRAVGALGKPQNRHANQKAEGQGPHQRRR
jgi:hypothetical protein